MPNSLPPHLPQRSLYIDVVTKHAVIGPERAAQRYQIELGAVMAARVMAVNRHRVALVDQLLKAPVT